MMPLYIVPNYTYKLLQRDALLLIKYNLEMDILIIDYILKVWYVYFTCFTIR